MQFQSSPSALAIHHLCKKLKYLFKTALELIMHEQPPPYNALVQFQCNLVQFQCSSSATSVQFQCTLPLEKCVGKITIQQNFALKTSRCVPICPHNSTSAVPVRINHFYLPISTALLLNSVERATSALLRFQCSFSAVPVQLRIDRYKKGNHFTSGFF